MEFFCERIQAHVESDACKEDCAEYNDCIRAGHLNNVLKATKLKQSEEETVEKEIKPFREKTGSVEWVQSQIFHRWQVVRRHPDYVEFCSGRNFINGCLDVWETMEPKAEEVMQKFGLELIYDPTLDIPKENLIDFPIFKDAFAVSYEWTTDEEGVRTPIWDERFIILEIDITKRVKHAGKEMREFIEEARRHADIQEPKRGDAYQKDALAIGVQWNLDDSGAQTCVWDDHFIKLKIDIAKKLSQIEAELRERVEEARQIATIQEPKSRLREREEAYKVWDLTVQKKQKKEIIAELWPEELEEADLGDAKAQARFEELSDKYKKQRLENRFERAREEAYGTGAQGGTINRLYMRVKERLDTMEKEFKKVIIKR